MLIKQDYLTLPPYYIRALLIGLTHETQIYTSSEREIQKTKKAPQTECFFFLSAYLYKRPITGQVLYNYQCFCRKLLGENFVRVNIINRD